MLCYFWSKFFVRFLNFFGLIVSVSEPFSLECVLWKLLISICYVLPTILFSKIVLPAVDHICSLLKHICDANYELQASENPVEHIKTATTNRISASLRPFTFNQVEFVRIKYTCISKRKYAKEHKHHGKFANTNKCESKMAHKHAA